MNKIFLSIFLIIPAVLLAHFASVVSDKLSSPIISWSPKFIEEKISPGDTSEINIIFESKKDLQEIELWLAPELEDFITFTPEYFDSVSANAKNFVHLEISAPIETSLGVYDGTLHVRVGKRTIPHTSKITLNIVEPLREENLSNMLDVHKEAAQNFNEWLEVYGREEARQMTVNWLRVQDNVKETGISDDGAIWIVFTNGIEGDIETYPSGTLGGNEKSNLISPSDIQKMMKKINAAVFSGLISQPLTTPNQPIVVGNDRIIVLDPFLDELSGKSPQPYIYSKISPLTDATYLKNEEVTIDVIKTLYGYGAVNITTHGRLHRDVVGFLSGEKVTPINIFFHLGDLRNKRLGIGWHGLTPYYKILPPFITNYAKEPYPESLIYIGACQSLKNLTMANTFLDRGASTYFGFTRIMSDLFNKEKAEELFSNLIDKRQTSGEAFTDGLDPYWLGAEPEYGYESEPAKFEVVGETDLILLLTLPSWLSAVNISNNMGDSLFPAITSDVSGYLHLVWVDNTPGNWEILYSMWDGTNWSEPLNISNTPGISTHPTITSDILGHVHIAWDERVSLQNSEIFYTMRNNTWLSPVNISNTPGYSSNPDIVSDNLGYPHIVWNDQPSPANTEIFYAAKNGNEWISPVNISGNWGHSRDPSVTLDNFQYPHVVWRDESFGNREVLYGTWNGTHWSTPINISKTPEYSSRPNIVAVNNNLHVVWGEAFTPSNSEIFYSVRGEDAVWSSPINISNTSGGSGYPVIASNDQGYLHLVWYDFTAGNGEVFYSRLNEIGWSTPINISDTTAHSYWPAVVADIFDHIHVVWSERVSDNNLEILYTTK